MDGVRVSGNRGTGETKGCVKNRDEVSIELAQTLRRSRGDATGTNPGRLTTCICPSSFSSASMLVKRASLLETPSRDSRGRLEAVSWPIRLKEVFPARRMEVFRNRSGFCNQLFQVGRHHFTKGNAQVPANSAER